MAVEPAKPIKRSRKGCHNCKRLKIKCDEAKPKCAYCIKTGADCDYSIKLTWGGRPYKDASKRKNPFQHVTNGDQKKKVKNQLKFINSDMDSPRSEVFTPLAPVSSYQSTDSQYSLKLESVANSSMDTTNSINQNLQSIGLNASTSLVDSNYRDKLDDKRIYVDSPGLSAFIQGDHEMSPEFLPMEDHLDRFERNSFERNIFRKDIDKDDKEDNDKFDKEPFAKEVESDAFGRTRSKVGSFNSLLNAIPNLSDGIESLSNALENVADGGMQFSLQNSELFNKFLNNIESPREIPLVHSPEIEEIDYSMDLEKSQAYMKPRTPESFHFLTKYPMRFRTEEEYPLDFDNSPEMQFFETIPPSLMPLPEILNQVPYYRQLMHFWINTAADNLVPAPKHIYRENPFKVLLPQMAMEFPAILTTILAFAATSMASITKSEAPTEIVDHLVSRSCNQLLKMLKDKDEATSDGTLATVLLLSCYEVISNDNFDRHRAHALGAGQIIKARKSRHKVDSPNNSPDSNSSTNAGTESDIAFFLMRWFVYVDVIGALSSTKNSQYYLNAEESGVKYKAGESVTSYSSYATDDPKRDIDYLLGFDPQFLPYLADIAFLIRKVDAIAQDNNGDPHLPIEIVTRALEVKLNLSKAYEQGEARRQEQLDKWGGSLNDIKKTKRYNNMVKQDFVLRCTNKLFYNMGLLNLNRRVLQIQRTSIIVQELASEIGSILEANIASGSSAEICTIFCLFCAGCDTLDENMRLLFKHRFVRLSEMGNVLATKSLTIMERCWETGEDWIQAARKLDIDVTLL